MLLQRLFGKPFGDKGYISQKWVEQLLDDHPVQLLTFARTHMQGRMLQHNDVVWIRKRAIMEPINDELKSISQVEHSRHRAASGTRTVLS